MKNISLLSILLIIGIALSSISYSCNEDPDVITVVERDTIIVTQVDTVFAVITDTLVITELMSDTATTFILVRHAEKSDIGTDPSLSAEGVERAEELRRILENTSLAAVYSSDFNRTRETAQPTADNQGLDLQIYNPSSLDPFVDMALADHKSEKLLVVGHSNTTPDLLNILVGENVYDDIPETEYDNFYLVSVFEKGRSNVIHLKFGN